MNASKKPTSTEGATGAKLRDGAIVAGQMLLRALWLGIIPILLTGVTFRYLIPGAITSGATSFENDLARFRVEDPVTFAVCVFLVFAILARYWRFYLPGGWLMAPLAPHLAKRVAREQLVHVAAAAELERSLVKPKTRTALEARLEPEALAALDARLSDVRAAVAAGDGGRAQELRKDVSRLAAPALRMRQLAGQALFVAAVAAAGWCALFLRNNVFQSYRVLSESMLPTLQPGDHVAGNKRAYGLRLPGAKEPERVIAPRRGDVVVFQMPGGGPHSETVKRVIGLPGDHVTMHRGRPVINGWLVPNCHVGSYFYLSSSGKPVTGRLAVEFLDDQAYLTAHTPVIKASPSNEVKAGEVFVLGDNRNASRDSRSFSDGGGRGVTFADIVARVDRLVVHAKRDGGIDLNTAFQPLGALSLNLDGTDVGSLDAGIKSCLGPERRPKETHPPPAAGGPSAAALTDVAQHSPGASQ